ncbi:hypothetical protein ABZ465_23505 [Streptomyces griseoincarnatus]
MPPSTPARARPSRAQLGALRAAGSPPRTTAGSPPRTAIGSPPNNVSARRRISSPGS